MPALPCWQMNRVLSEAGVSHALSINRCAAGSSRADLGARRWGWRQAHWEKPARGRVGGNRFPQELGTNLAPWGGGRQPLAPLPLAPIGWEQGRGAQPFPAKCVVLQREPLSEPAQGPGCHAGCTRGDLVGQPSLGAGTGGGGVGMGLGACFLLLSRSVPPQITLCMFVGVEGSWGICLHWWGGW